jgi:Ca-activated chloride channel family protein
MRRILLLLPLILLLLVLVPIFRTASPIAAPDQSPARVTQVDTAHYPDVTLYVGVTSADGQPVGGLAARDFAVTEDGQPVTIADFAGAAGPISTVLVIDRSGSMDENDKIDGAQDAARAFVEQMRPGDQTELITFNQTARVAERFTGSQDELLRAIDDIDADGGTALYDSMIAGVDALKNVSGRRALLLLTDGQDCRESAICPDEYGSRRSLDQAVAYAEQQGQPVYVIGLGDRDSDEQDGIDEGVLRTIAQGTSGEYFYAPSGDQLAELYRTLSAGLQQEYTLTYRSPRPFYDGTRRDIRVSVGGGPAATGGYVERHLIDVRSDPRVGLLLLLPVLGALLAPTLLRRRTTLGPKGTPGSGPTTDRRPPTPASLDSIPIAIDHSPAIGSTIMQPAGLVVIPADVARCTSCDAALLRAGARFCAECGAAQTVEPLRRIFCDQCGRPMRDRAQFCSHCGMTTPAPVGRFEREHDSN